MSATVPPLLSEVFLPQSFRRELRLAGFFA